MMINYNQIVESRKNSQLKSSRLSKDSSGQVNTFMIKRKRTNSTTIGSPKNN